jgi:hypothetical protein
MTSSITSSHTPRSHAFNANFFDGVADSEDDTLSLAGLGPLYTPKRRPSTGSSSYRRERAFSDLTLGHGDADDFCNSFASPTLCHAQSPDAIRDVSEYQAELEFFDLCITDGLLSSFALASSPRMSPAEAM